MNALKITLFGTPSVVLDGHPVTFAYKKAAALFYYLLLNQKVPRNEAASLLWGDSDSASALKNLRHAIYTIRKNLGIDIFNAGQTAVLELRDDLDIDCDVLNFVEENILLDTQKEFMEGFSLQHCEVFEDWMNEQRRILHSRYLEILLAQEKKAFQSGDLSTAERLGLRYVHQDPLEESAAVMLMQLYRAQKKYRRAIGIYNELYKNLSAELSISPLKETSDLYYKIIDEWNSSTEHVEEESNELLLGKDGVLSEILSLCNRPLTESRTPCAVIKGEAGVGKTYLLDHVLNDYDFSDWLICRSYCYQSESHIPLSPWNSVMMTLMTEMEAGEFTVPENFRKNASILFPCLSASCGQDFVTCDMNYNIQQSYHMAQESALLIFAAAARHIPLLLVFEDIHWMDKNSIDLLAIFLRRLRNLKVTVLCTSRTIYPDYVRDFMDSALSDNIACMLNVDCFNEQETALFAQHYIKSTSNPGLNKQLYERTGGNALLLVQMINILQEHPEYSTMSDDFGDIIGTRLANLPPDEHQVLDLISVFPDRAPFDMLSSILTKNSMELMYLCNQLQRRMLIQENCVDNTLAYSLTHELIRSSLVKQQSAPARRILHSRVAQYLEENMDRNGTISYERLIYHFREGGDQFKVFQYQVAALEAYTGLHYAVLPTLETGVDSKSEVQNLEDYFHMLEGELSELRSSRVADSDTLDQLEMTLLLAKGRYAVYVGEYKPGLSALDKLTKLCNEKHADGPLISAQFQYICFGIQTYNTKIMSIHLEILNRLLSEKKDSENFGIYLRMEGLLQLMSGNYVLSRAMLQKSIQVFENLAPNGDDRYTINIAGAYNYIAESYRMEHDYQQAFLAYDQAILYNRSRGYYPGTAVFYTNYGVAAAQSGEHRIAKQLLNFALETYREAHEYSERPIALSHMAYYEAEAGNFGTAAKYIKEGVRISAMIGSPLWKAIVCYQGWRIHVMIARRHQDAPELCQLWPQDLTDHTNKCLSKLKNVTRGTPPKDIVDAIQVLTDFLADTSRE